MTMTRIVTTTIIGLILTACNSAPQAQSGGMAFPPVPVSVGTATEETVPIQVRAVGNVEPYSTVEVKAQVGGQLLNVRFAEGANVNKSDRAALEQAKLNLAYSEIRAPLSGRTGNLLMHVGNLVKANDDKPLVVINQIAPIFVTFGVPERYLSLISQQNSRRKLMVEVAPGKESEETIRGTLAVIDNTVDKNTGTIRLKAVFDNRDASLWPGQFANVVLTMDRQTATVIPAEAVQAGQQGSFVYVVKSDETVEPRPLTIGQTVGGKVMVQKGLVAGETIVTDGQSRLFPGAKIVTAK